MDVGNSSIFLYIGQFVESASSGTAPAPWDLRCNPTQMFHNETHHLEVPFSATITVAAL